MYVCIKLIRLFFYLDGSAAIQYFVIDSRTGVIRIRERIDLESSTINRLGSLLEFSVRAIEIGDKTSYETTRVIVSIIDINDNVPKFNKNAYHMSLLPKSPVALTLTLQESDIDSIHVLDPDKVSNHILLIIFKYL